MIWKEEFNFLFRCGGEEGKLAQVLPLLQALTAREGT